MLKELERFPERDRGFSRNVSHVLIENMIKAEKNWKIARRNVLKMLNTFNRRARV